MNYGKKSTAKKRTALISRSSMMGKRARVSFIRVLFVSLIALCIAVTCLGVGSFRGVIDNAPDVDDIDIMHLPIKEIRENIGYCPQDNFLFSDTIKNNIAFSNENMELSEVKEAAKFSSVDDNIEGFKDKYDTLIGEKGVSLSGGQKQRISISRAIIKDPKILILDDSVSAVDVKTEETILSNIKNIRKGKTTLIIASRVSTVQHLDKILVLRDGQVDAFGTHEECLAKSKIYARMVELQLLEKEMEAK